MHTLTQANYMFGRLSLYAPISRRPLHRFLCRTARGLKLVPAAALGLIPIVPYSVVVVSSPRVPGRCWTSCWMTPRFGNASVVAELEPAFADAVGWLKLKT